MPTITALDVQKKNSRRVSVFVDGEYSFSVFDELVHVYHLEIGKDVNTIDLKALAEEDEYKRAFSRAIKNLSRSEKSQKQIFDLLTQNEFCEDIIKRVILRLLELDYLSDERLAKDFVARSNSLGLRAIKAKLKQKGISDEIINNVLSCTDETDSAIELAKKLMQKHSALDNFKRKKKVSDFLARRGYSWDTISYAISRAEEEE